MFPESIRYILITGRGPPRSTDLRDKTMTNSMNKLSSFASLFLAALPVLVVLAAVNVGNLVGAAV